jgi:hypothetical protein
MKFAKLPKIIGLRTPEGAGDRERLSARVPESRNYGSARIGGLGPTMRIAEPVLQSNCERVDISPREQ